jgi:hypothetical protein
MTTTKYKPATVHVVGLTFQPGYPNTLLELHELLESHDYTTGNERIAVVLVRNPDNPVDPNAVEVHVPAIGHMIGHVPRGVAARLAPLLDEGVRYHTSVEWVRVDPDHPENPGIDIRVERVEDE